MALELAAARLLAIICTPIMPNSARSSGRSWGIITPCKDEGWSKEPKFCRRVSVCWHVQACAVAGLFPQTVNLDDMIEEE